MSKEREALKRLKQETAPATYNADAYTFKEECIATLEAALDVLDLIKPLCEVYETEKLHYMYLKVSGVIVYTFKDRKQFNLFKEWLENEH